jgi:hypothetical protein
MTSKSTTKLTIAQILEQFFASYRQNAGPAVRARVSAVREDLERHLESEGPRILTSAQLTLLSREREFAPDGAFRRTMHSDDLYYALEHYLHPAHAMAGLDQHEAQLDVVGALAEWLWRSRLIAGETVSECTIIEFDIAMTRSRDVVKAALRQRRAMR